MYSNILVWRNLRAHPLRSILTALAIALGVGMVLAAAIVGQAAGRTASGLSEKGPRTDLQVFARDESLFDDAVLDTLRAFPDVESVLPALRVEAEGIHPMIPRLALLGVDPEAYQALHGPELVSGAFLDGPDTLVLPVTIALRHGLHRGDEFTLAAGERTVTLTVSGRLAAEHDGSSLFRETSAMAFVPLDTAQVLAGAPGQIDCVKVALRPGVDVDGAKSALAQQIGTDLVVVRAEVAGEIAFNTLLIQGGLVMVGMIILFAAGFVILNAFAMSTAARTREIGALRALGMTRRQVIRTVLAEASLLGLVGAGVGMLVGLGLAWGVMRAMGLLGDVPFVVPWWGMVFSPFLGLGVTLAGALQPAWRASRVSPLVAVRSETTIASGWYIRSGGRVGLVLLLLVLPALAAYGQIVRPGIWMAMAVTGVGIATLLIATVLLLPAMVVPTAAFCRPVLVRWLGTAGRLAADNLGRNKLRSALTAGALVAGLTMMTATSGLLTLFLEGSIGLIGPMSHEDIFVIRDFVAMMASGEMSLDNLYQTMADFTLDPALAGDLDPLVKAGVIEIERVGIAPVPPELATVPTGIAGGMFVDPGVFLRIGNFDFFKGDPETALEWMQRGRAVLLQPLAAERLGVSVGDTIPIETSRGKIDFTVAGVGGSSLFSPIFSYTDGEAYFDLAGLFQLNIVVRQGEDIEAVLAQVQEIIRPFPGVVAMRDVDAVIDEATRMFDQFQTLLKALLLLAAVVAALGVVNTMVINVAERGREIGLLRAVGATQRQVRRAVVAEAATLGLMAAFIASGLGLAILLVYVLVVTPNGWGALGVRADGATVWRGLLSALGDMGITALVSLIFAPLVAALAATYPARQAAAMNVVEATRSERVTLKRTMAIRPSGQRAKGFPRPIEFVMARRNLAQAIGGAVTIPVRQEEGGARRVIWGNPERVFQEETRNELVLPATTFNRMVIGLQEREWLRDTFGRFVSHEMAEAIRTGQVRLEGENRVVSVLFCDIQDFAARSAQSTPEEMVALLNDYLPVVVEAAQQHEGTVNKFGRESTLVIYGAPRRLQESAYRAVLTALEIRDNLQALNTRLAERGQAPIRIGVGVNIGVVLAGTVGPKDRQEYTVIGDTVNLASRIEALSRAYPEYKVLVSGPTYEALGRRRKEFEFATLGKVPIRGKAEPVRVWAVVERRGKR